jgi:hypothetical protein
MSAPRERYHRVLGEFFCHVSRRMQMNLIFSDNVSILCLSYNIKKPKATTTLSKMRRHEFHYNRVDGVLFGVRINTVTMSYHVLPSLNMVNVFLRQ